MNIQVLIDSIVRQTTISSAQLPREEPERASFYAGQTVLGLWDEESSD